jgi:uncharacterized repeat protein (TIGR03803 family)
MAKINVLVSFNGTDGSQPFGELIADAAGNLFGTTKDGGTSNKGTVFEVTKTAGTFSITPTTLASFNTTDGSNPAAGLLADASGNLFGTTEAGGKNHAGGVFEILHVGGTYSSSPTLLASFNTTDGSAPESNLVADGDGNLFGTTSTDGMSHDGTVFELAKTAGGFASTPTMLTNFNNFDGDLPKGSLLDDGNGGYIGVTFQGGANNDGTIFDEPKSGGAPAVLSDMGTVGPVVPGEEPSAGLIADSQGNLFGTTFLGGTSNLGTVFELARINGTYSTTTTILANFNGTNGADPSGSLLMDKDGDLFGTTTAGGENGDGTVFEIAKAGDGYADTPTKLVDFDNSNGNNPSAALIADSAGNLFGTTLAGGKNGDGTVFEVTGSGFVICFLPGTLIATPGGELAVEHLSTGDLVVTRSGSLRRVVWIGNGRVLATPSRRTAATPVIVRKGALADNVPHRDLRVTKGHCLYSLMRYLSPLSSSSIIDQYSGTITRGKSVFIMLNWKVMMC